MTRLKYERKRLRLSQQRLAAMAGLCQWHVSLMERGRLLPTSEQLMRLALALDVSDVDLLAQVVVVPQSEGSTLESAR